MMKLNKMNWPPASKTTSALESTVPHAPSLPYKSRRKPWPRITDSGLPYLCDLPNFKGLQISGTRVTDAGLRHLYSMKTLVGINVSGTRVTPDGARDLKRALPNCRITL